MRIVVAGGHGKIALRLERLLANRGDQVVGIVRSPDQVDDLRAVGAEGVVADLETCGAGELARHLTGADAVVFAAGAGPGSGAARKETVDRGAAVLLADAAELAGVRRYLMVSAMRVEAEPPPGSDEVFVAYLRAKRAADDDLRTRDLDWTILRPGRLTDSPGTGRLTLADVSRAINFGAVPRDDVAAVLLALLDEPATIGRALDLISGDTPITDAVVALSG